MSAYVLIEGTFEDGSPMETEVHEWFSANSGAEVRDIYLDRYPDKVWENGSLYREKLFHTIYGECRTANTRTTFHNEHPHIVRKETL